MSGIIYDSIKKTFALLLVLFAFVFTSCQSKTNRYTSVYSIFLSGEDVYAVGSVCSGDSRTDVPVLWKNGELQKIGSMGNFNHATSIFVSGEDVYATITDSENNRAYLWKNGTKTPLGSNRTNCVFVGGKFVHESAIKDLMKSSFKKMINYK